MIGLGTIVNCCTIAAGTTLGVFLKGGLPRRFETTIMQALGLCTFFIGIGGGAVVVVVVLFFLFRAIFASMVAELFGNRQT